MAKLAVIILLMCHVIVLAARLKGLNDDVRNIESYRSPFCEAFFGISRWLQYYSTGLRGRVRKTSQNTYLHSLVFFIKYNYIITLVLINIFKIIVFMNYVFTGTYLKQRKKFRLNKNVLKIKFYS